MTQSVAVRADELAAYALGLGDDALILAQRLSEWVTRAPQIEEDVALANIALDLLGQARFLLSRSAELGGAGVDEDELAYLRTDQEFRNLRIVEQPNGDFAVTMARQLLFSAYQYELYQALCESADDVVAAVAARGVKEVAYHRDHATQWVLRLGDGTDVSHERMQAGLRCMRPYVDEMFEPLPADSALVVAGYAVDPPSLEQGWAAYVRQVVERATLVWPEPVWQESGGRRGVHGEEFGLLLAEMQHLHRSHPGASW